MAPYAGGVGKFLLVVVVFAALVYLTVRVIERRGVKPAPRRNPEPRVMGPDDDPDFLWDLDRRKRHPDDPAGPADPDGPTENA